MRYKIFGRSGLRVSELCLGTMTFGEAWGWGASKAESAAMLDAFLDAGGNFLDTANRYTDGQSELFLGELLGDRRERVVLGSKYSLTEDPSDPNAGGNHRKALKRSIEGSLRRLRTDYLDILWLHLWGGLTPIDEVMRALDDLVRAGTVLALGISNTPAWVVARAMTLAEQRGWTPFSGLQVRHSLLEREAERELIPMAEALGLCVTPWAPLAGGALTGKYRRGQARPDGARYGEGAWGDAVLTERAFQVIDALLGVAEELGRSPAQVALNWLASRRRPVTVPILGARRSDQLRDTLKAVEFKLDDEQRRRLDEASRQPLGYPHDHLAGDRAGVHGRSWELIDRS